jgi:DNA-binding NarL/FixJ family response regulator
VPGSDTIRIVVVEDNDVFRESLELVLELEPGIDVIGSAGTGREGVALCEREQPEVALVDFRLPDLDGVETTRAIRTASPATAVVALTAAAGDRELDALRVAGAAACLRKDRAVADIVAAIRESAPA